MQQLNPGLYLCPPSYIATPHPSLHGTEQTPDTQLQPYLLKLLYTLLPTCGLDNLVCLTTNPLEL